MKELLILGSAAAEGVPAIFCDCPTCRTAWRTGGKNMRKRTAYRIGPEVAVDFGPDTMAQEQMYRLHSERLRHLFLSHSHEDHFAPELLIYRKNFSRLPEGSHLDIYADQAAVRAMNIRINQYIGFRNDIPAYHMTPHIVEPFTPVEMPDQDMTAWALPADHMIDEVEEPVFYLFRTGPNYILIANDTGYFPEASWKFLEEKKFPLDVVILDCTGGTASWVRGHMGGETILKTRERLRSIAPVRRCIVNHFSHNGGDATHEGLEKFFLPHGIEVGFDGMTIPLGSPAD